MSEIVELEVQNPRGAIEPLPVNIPSPRIQDFNGKVVGLYSNGKDGMDNFYTVFTELLKKKYPTAKTSYLSGGYFISDEEVEKWVKQIDSFVYGVGD
jgi:hypothetical protein